MDWFLKIDEGYNKYHYYTKADVAYFVTRGRITQAQYKQITGEDYPN